MKIHVKILLLSLTISGFAQAVTWNDYYRTHEKEIIAAVASGQLDLKKKSLTDLIGFDQIPGLDELKSLYLDNNLLTTLNGIRNLPALVYLEVTENRLISFIDLENLPALESLLLTDNQLSSLEGLRNLPTLIHLGLDGNRITSLADIANLPALEVLYLSNNPITTIKDIGRLPSLQEFMLENCQVTNLEGIEKLPALTQLRLRNNKLISLAGIEKLTALEELNLGKNQLPTLEGVENLPALQTLHVFENPIPGSTEYWRKKLKLERLGEYNFVFKGHRTEKAEEAIIKAIKAGDQTMVQQQFKELLAIRTKLTNKAYQLDIAKIRDFDSNNLLQLAEVSAHKKITEIAGEIRNVIQGQIEKEELVVEEGAEAKEKTPLTEKEQEALIEQLKGQIAEINDRYLNIVSTIVTCGDICVKDMLNSRNANGKTVQQLLRSYGIGATLIDTLYGFSPNNPVYQAIGKLAAEQPAMAVEQKEEKEKEEKQRVAERA